MVMVVDVCSNKELPDEMPETGLKVFCLDGVPSNSNNNDNDNMITKSITNRISS